MSTTKKPGLRIIPVNPVVIESLDKSEQKKAPSSGQIGSHVGAYGAPVQASNPRRSKVVGNLAATGAQGR